MYFQLRKLVLWPRINADPRVVEFTPGIVNVISGASKTGKSAVIPIIDYCLGAEKCTIPVGVIRKNCGWFGIVVDTIEGQKLLARREPGDQQSTGDMVLIEAPEVEVPRRIEEKNTNADEIKRILNRLAGLTNLEFEPGTENPSKYRPSYRDLMAFTFQPQNIVANPNVMFFKADMTEHREKLKTIFPYVLGAVTAAVLHARFELERLNRILRRKEGELRNLDAVNLAWQVEAQAWLRQGIEFGLLSPDQAIPVDWPAILDLLRKLVGTQTEHARPSLAGIDVALTRLDELRGDEAALAASLNEHRQRLNELRRLRESSSAYGSAMYVQRDRLALADWMRTLIGTEAAHPLVTLARGGRDELMTLCDNLEAVEVKIRTHPTVSDTLDKETLRQRAAAEDILTQLNEVRGEIAGIERESETARSVTDHFDRTERFLGRLEQALQLYDRADGSSVLREEIARLRAQLGPLERIISEAQIKRRLDNALARVEAAANLFVPQLDAEWADAPIKFAIEELTIKVVQGARSDFLWEIGSGANWLAYHVATTLALQKFFLTEPHHAVPGLLIYDQPSQVYFPQRLAEMETGETETAVAWPDEDVQAVRKVFSLLGNEVRASKGRLQTIVLDHAGADVWGGLDGVALTEEWRHGRALVPKEWFAQQTPA
jgi:hypothetical protein